MIAGLAGGWATEVMLAAGIPAPGQGYGQPRALTRALTRIVELAADRGRDPSAMEMVVVGNVEFTERPAGADRGGFVGSLDQIIEDVATVKDAGADELIVDLHLQDWWQSTEQMLEMAVEIRERGAAAGI